MIINIIYIILALLGIGFLIFIHELGHYFMARKVGITVEVFAIGFGKSLIEWEHKGVKWKLGWIPFGGYVKMAGTEKKGAIEPYQIPDGYFGKKPWDRIKVAAMGPIMNILFAFLAFSLLWALGGREKPFSEFTTHVGWIDQESGIYHAQMRPGDKILSFNGKIFTSFTDFKHAAFDKQIPKLTGLEIDYYDKKTRPISYVFPIEKEQEAVSRVFRLFSIMTSAQYLVYNKPNQLLPNSPLENSGISLGDRILWVDGELIFSMRQLMEVINSSYVLLSVQRGNETFITRIPKLKIRDLRLGSFERAELDDWRNETSLKEKIENLYFIPYNLSDNAVVENPLSYIDENSKEQLLYEQMERKPFYTPLVRGDRILAIHGKKISFSYQLLEELQTYKSLIIVKKEKTLAPISWKEADRLFEDSFPMTDLKKMIASLSRVEFQTQVGPLHLLQPVTPISYHGLSLSQKQKATIEEKLEHQKKAIEKIADPKQREEVMREFELYQNRLMLGIRPSDKFVFYNPSPFALFGDVIVENYRTLYALITGVLSPKYLAGPVGIVQVIHHGWTLGIKEAIYWLGMISLCLALLNLLPIPVLDGGHICIAAIESITKKPLKAKTLERLIIPFVILMIALFIYLTYNDLARLISQFFS